jgi:SAM-dependent methyltransferase
MKDRNRTQQNQACQFELVKCCDLCGGARFEQELVAGKWTLAKCTDCGLIFTLPRFRQTYLERLYRDDYYDRASSYLTMQVAGPSRDDYWLSSHLKKICCTGKGNRKPRSLDVGCGAGRLTKAFQDNGWEAVGVDVSLRAVGIGINAGLDLRAAELGDSSLGLFDVITCFHVLEHASSPKFFLFQCAEHLLENGYLVIEVPDYGSRRASRMGENWPYPHPSIHLYHFTRQTLGNYLEGAKFRIIKIRKVHGKGPLENSASTAGDKFHWESRFKNSLFTLRHLLYWSPITRQLLRYLFWDAMRYGECIRILAQKICQ